MFNDGLPRARNQLENRDTRGKNVVKCLGSPDVARLSNSFHNKKVGYENFDILQVRMIGTKDRVVGLFRHRKRLRTEDVRLR